jgi:hypothetical protein
MVSLQLHSSEKSLDYGDFRISWDVFMLLSSAGTDTRGVTPALLCCTTKQLLPSGGPRAARVRCCEFEVSYPTVQLHAAALN